MQINLHFYLCIPKKNCNFAAFLERTWLVKVGYKEEWLKNQSTHENS